LALFAFFKDFKGSADSILVSEEKKAIPLLNIKYPMLNYDCRIEGEFTPGHWKFLVQYSLFIYDILF